MHTPGPWRLSEELGDKNGNYADSARRWTIDAPGKRAAMSISEAWKSKDNPDIWDEVRANAKIMAAAPELLDALEMVLIASEDGGDINDIDFEQIREAIAKAKNA